jgi:hypothetical protein
VRVSNGSEDQRAGDLPRWKRTIASSVPALEPRITRQRAERDVIVRRAPHVEAMRLRKHVLVAVGRDMPGHHLVALGDPLPPDLGVARAGVPGRSISVKTSREARGSSGG